MELNTIKPAEGAKKAQPPRRPRHRLGPGQDRGSRPQGPEVARGRLPQGRLRRRPDAAAAPPAQARLQVAARCKFNAESHAGATCERLGAAEVDLLTLKQAGLVRRAASRRSRSSSPASSTSKVELKGIGATAGAKAAIEAAGGSRRLSEPQPRRKHDQWQPARISWRRAASSATCVAGWSSCCSRSWSIASARTSPCRASTRTQLAAAVQGPAGRHPEPVQHVLGRRAVALHRVRAGHHAVHLGVDHHAADDLRGADAGGAEEGRRSRPPQDHAVHALRHARPGDVPVARHRAGAGRLGRPGDRLRASASA